MRVLALAPTLLLSGCASQHFWILKPHGLIASTELHYMVLDVLVMMVVIIPAIALAMWAVWRYRASSGKGKYTPNWDHSNTIEVIVWGIPILVVAVLGYFSYMGTHEVNPWKPKVIEHNSTLAHATPLNVDVITTDWQWLFIYPELNFAVSNHLVVPIDTPVKLRLTSISVTNDFFIPQIVGQIFVMPGMRTEQTLVASRMGSYQGISAELSGPGFAWMDFKMQAVKRQAFDAWAQQAKASSDKLTYDAFAEFAKPTVNLTGKVRYFSGVQPGLFRQVIAKVRSGQLRYPTPVAMTENMQSKEFQQHAN